MVATNNPAGRLHHLLTRYLETKNANPGISNEAIWRIALTLETSPILAMAKISGLLSDIEESAELYAKETGDNAAFESTRLHLHEWAAPLVRSPIPHSQGISPDRDMVSATAMSALATISSTFSLWMPDGTEVDKNTRDHWRSLVLDVIESVRLDTQLPQQLRLLILSRLYSVLQAVDDYLITGIDGLRTACDRLTVALLLDTADDSHEPTGWRAKIRGLVTSAFQTIGLIQKTADAVESSVKAIEALTQ